jgi:hypothetical protein
MICEDRLIDRCIAVETGSSRQVPREVNAEIHLDSPTAPLTSVTEV